MKQVWMSLDGCHIMWNDCLLVTTPDKGRETEVRIAKKAPTHRIIITCYQLMLDNHYKVDTSPDLRTFEFISVGPKGNIAKVVRYTELNLKGFYNLGFGDKDPITGFISDLTVTNNGAPRNSHLIFSFIISKINSITQACENLTRNPLRLCQAELGLP